MLRPQSCSQQITGQDQLYQRLKEHLYYLIQWHGEHESAKTKLLQHLDTFCEQFTQLLQFSILRCVVSNVGVTFNVANNGRCSVCRHHDGLEVQIEGNPAGYVCIGEVYATFVYIFCTILAVTFALVNLTSHIYKHFAPRLVPPCHEILYVCIG